MHMFSRVSTLTGGPQRPLEWALGITERVNAVMDVDVSLWGAAFGYPGGTVAWSTLVESRAHLTEQMGKLAGDTAFVSLAEQGLEFATTPYEDSLRTIVHMTAEPDGTPPPLGAMAELITASPAAGKIGAAMAWGVEMADRYAAVTGSGVAFLADDYGTFGQASWIVIHDDAAAADAAATALMADEAYGAAVDGGGNLFVPGSATRAAVVRLG